VKKRKREKKTYGIIFNLEELNNNIDISTTEIDDSGRNIYILRGNKNNSLHDRFQSSFKYL